MTNGFSSPYRQKNTASLLGFRLLHAPDAVVNFLIGNYRASSELASKMGFKPSQSLGRLLLEVADHDEA